LLSRSNVEYTNHLCNYVSFYIQTKIFIYLNYLEGNEVNKFLANVDKLAKVIPLQFFEFIQFFKDMENMMKSVFGYTLNPNYKDIISRLRNSFEVVHKRFQVPETVKIHIMLVHVEQFIDITGKPLGEYSEQALEDSHSLFHEYWKRFLVKDIDSDIYLERYKKCILSFNASNV
jgi:hypothetical protein